MNRENRDHIPPEAGGCWICSEIKEGERIEFDFGFDTFYHPVCLDDEFDSILEFEQNKTG